MVIGKSYLDDKKSNLNIPEFSVPMNAYLSLKVREFTLPLTAVTSRDEFRKFMSMQGVAVTKMDEIMQYTTTWVNELQARETADEAHRQFGWAGKDMETFILGNQKVYKDRIDFNPPASTTISLFSAFDPKGSLEEWKRSRARPAGDRQF